MTSKLYCNTLPVSSRVSPFMWLPTVLEARIADHQPVEVSHEAETMKQVIDGVAEKLKRSTESTFGRLDKIR